MKTTKRDGSITKENLTKMYFLLKENYGYNEFKVSELEKILINDWYYKGLSKLHLYDFVLAGAVVKNKEGYSAIYRMLPWMDETKISFVQERSKKIKKERRITKMKYNPSNQSKLIEQKQIVDLKKHSVIVNNETDAISYLKSLGYKIMKPIQNFEEI